MKKICVLVLAIALFLSPISPALADSTALVPCKESKAFLERQSNAPDGYYFDQPYKAYSEYLLCGEDGLPHLALRFDRAVDAAIPFALFFYVAGFIGWSGRAYLISSKNSNEPEQNEVFINIPLAILSLIKGLLWPLMFIQELATGQLTAKEDELYVSPR